MNISKRLQDIRKQAKISQPELAKRLGVDKSLISRWEKTERTPSIKQLSEITRVLGISLDYLLNAELDVKFQFRSTQPVSGEEKTQITKVIKDAVLQINNINSAYKLANVLPPVFNIKMDFYQPHIAQMALEIREAFKLNQKVTLAEFKQALSERNVHVFEWYLPHKMSGFSYRGAFSVIFINRSHPAQRRLFTLVHEFAHLLFHLGRDHNQTIVSLISSTRDPIEKEASIFASELLIPNNELLKLLEIIGKDSKSPNFIHTIAAYFNVSPEAVFYRLVELKYFEWSEKNKFFKKLNYQLQLEEYYVDEIEEQVDTKFLQTALNLYDNEEISVGKLCEWIFTSRESIETFIASRHQIFDQILEL
ncbi:MAG: ImmA/IrrE family metallo-endopeptidase [Bacteroidetes bacterium]|nr:ImmA/IrrE family metallo-endopeptidase [Bacteroidota bacterium]MBU2584850.1 ImmA/IrrE family metallo-endopeptidase [Bacteroidota bacterium]